LGEGENSIVWQELTPNTNISNYHAQPVSGAAKCQYLFITSVDLNMNIETVKQAIGILNFKKTELLEIALTHPSYIYENNNLNQLQKDQQKREYRRLALLGDSILGTVVIDYLYDRLLAENQGTLTNWKSDLVRRNKAYDFARNLNLRRLCMLGQGEKFRDESGQIQLFGEMFEALLGAIYLEFERDFSRARNWLVDRFIAGAVDDLLTDTPISEEQLFADDVQAVSLMNSDEAAEQLWQMKQQADALVAENEEFQQLLTWVNEKAIAVEGSYNPAKVRAFYFALVGILGRAFVRNFDPTRSKAKDRNQARQFALSFNRAHDLAIELAFELNHNTDPGKILIPIFALDLEPRLKQLLQQLQAELPDPKEDKEKFEDWRQNKGQDWVEEIKDAIGHDLQFSEQQKELLKQYYDANKLLIDCIYKASNVPPEVKEEILKTWFLPDDFW
jgi:dsRNA-specific ribonuclease